MAERIDSVCRGADNAATQARAGTACFSGFIQHAGVIAELACVARSLLIRNVLARPRSGGAASLSEVDG